MSQINNILNLTVEMEGLLRILRERPDADARALLLDKFDELSMMIYSEFPLGIDSQPSSRPHFEEETPEPIVTEEEIEENSHQDDELIDLTAPVNAEEPEKEIPVVIEAAPAPVVESVPSELRVDEMISQREARELGHAIKLNDKFRFMRELFGGDMGKYDRALQQISALQSFCDAERYLYTDCGLDRENETVKEFVSIVQNHFISR